MKDFVNFELAQKLKEKGYPQVKKNTLAMYDDEGDWFSLAATLDKDEYCFENFDDRACVCPTIAQVLAWLREEHKLHVCIDLDIDKNWFYSIESVNDDFQHIDSSDYDSYEKTAVSGIHYVLDELIKQKSCSMKVRDLIELINSSGELYCLYDASNIIPEGVKCVAEELDIDNHCWFSTAINVYACEDGYVGIRGVNTIDNGSTNPLYCDFPCRAFECEAVQITSYKPKK